MANRTRAIGAIFIVGLVGGASVLTLLPPGSDSYTPIVASASVPCKRQTWPMTDRQCQPWTATKPGAMRASADGKAAVAEAGPVSSRPPQKVSPAPKAATAPAMAEAPLPVPSQAAPPAPPPASPPAASRLGQAPAPAAPGPAHEVSRAEPAKAANPAADVIAGLSLRPAIVPELGVLRAPIFTEAELGGGAISTSIETFRRDTPVSGGSMESESEGAPAQLSPVGPAVRPPARPRAKKTPETERVRRQPARDSIAISARSSDGTRRTILVRPTSPQDYYYYAARRDAAGQAPGLLSYTR